MDALITIDFSAATTPVLATAARIGASGQSRLHLLHVLPPDPDFVGYQTGPATVREQVAKEQRSLQQRLAILVDALRDLGCDASAHVAQGPTVAMVLSEAERLDVTFIVVGSHGHGAVYDLLVGSTSEAIVRQAKRPVLVVPARG